MPSLFNSLAEISSEYTVFEKDQILTEAQLNSLSSYLDDQDRLNRINLIGIGLIDGLRVSLLNNVVTVTKGIGITTDGDLMRIAADTQYDRYKPYDQTFPAYPPLYTGPNSMLTVYELVETGVTDPLAVSLTGFEAATTSGFSDMVVVLLMESYIRDDDLCSGTDCDNRSQIYVTQIKPLLVSKDDISALTPSIQTAEAAALALNPLTADRVRVSTSITTPAQLAAQYRTACSNIHSRLVAELPNLWTQAGFLLADTFSADPTAGWVSQLNTIQSSFANSDTGIQYYYDFLRDLVETWNALRSALFTETAWCCPAIDGFAKHLLLGDLVPGADLNANRLEFYPSVAISREQGIKHGIFLAEKLNALIGNFAVPSTTTIRITPSYTAIEPLENRAIPWYYQLGSGSTVLSRWNYQLYRRSMERHNLSYHGASYSAEGAAADPLNFMLEQHNFFRIEGHIGRPATAAISAIENVIATYNLPFTVVGVLLGTSNGNLVGRRGAGFTDLNRFHNILRNDISYRLGDVSQFSSGYLTTLNTVVSDQMENNEITGNDGRTFKSNITGINNSLTQKVTEAQGKINVSYSTYRSNPSWRTDVNDVIFSANNYKYQVGRVSKTDFATPFEGLVNESKVDWLDWLDILIDDKDDQADAKKQYRNFIQEYPGMEHAAGVIRGGTFVVLYNTSGTVIGDFMLSHYIHEPVEEEVQEPSLPRPVPPRDWSTEFGVQLNPSWDNYFDNRFNDIRDNLNIEWQNRFDVSTYYADIFRDVVGSIPVRGVDVTAPGGGLTNPGGGIDIPGGGGVTVPGGGGIIIPGGGVTTPGGGVIIPGGGLTDPGGVMIDIGTVNPADTLTQPVGELFTDPLLASYGNQVDTQMGQIQQYEAALADDSLPAERQAFLERQRSAVQENLGNTVGAMAEYLSVTETDVNTAGTDGELAMQILNNGMSTIENTGNSQLRNQTRNQLQDIQRNTGNSNLARGLGGVLNRRF